MSEKKQTKHTKQLIKFNKEAFARMIFAARRLNFINRLRLAWNILKGDRNAKD